MNLPFIGEINISKHWNWIIGLLAILYIASPIDFIPDFIPIVGWIDDLFVLVAGLLPMVRGIFK